jgi:hypothetical protein
MGRVRIITKLRIHYYIILYYHIIKCDRSRSAVRSMSRNSQHNHNFLPFTVWIDGNFIHIKGHRPTDATLWLQVLHQGLHHIMASLY